MPTIRVRTRGKNDEKIFSGDEMHTIRDVKEKLKSKDPSSVLLTYKDKLLIDSTEISTLERDCILILENDIEFSEMYEQESKVYRAKVNEKLVSLKENDIFFKDGKSFLITRREKKIKISDVWSYFKKNLTKSHIVQFLFLAFIFSSRNYPLISIIVFINILKFISQMALKFKLWENIGDGALYAIFMFFASFIAIDHTKFLKKMRVE
jgi:hypothetical protein